MKYNFNLFSSSENNSHGPSWCNWAQLHCGVSWRTRTGAEWREAAGEFWQEEGVVDLPLPTLAPQVAEVDRWTKCDGASDLFRGWIEKTFSRLAGRWTVGGGGINHNRGVTEGRLDRRWTRGRWLDSRGHCGVSDNSLQWIASWVKDGWWESRGRSICRGDVALRLHWSEEINFLQTETELSTRPPPAGSITQPSRRQWRDNHSTQAQLFKSHTYIQEHSTQNTLWAAAHKIWQDNYKAGGIHSESYISILEVLLKQNPA